MKLSTLAFAAALLMPAAASAQEILHFEGVKTAGGDKVGTAATGAYQASRAPFNTKFDIYCVDYDHFATSVWTARELSFADATGANLLQAQRQLGTEKSWGLAELRAAAWLSTQFATNPVGLGAADDNWDTIHGAIWSMFSNNASVNQSAMLTMAASAVSAHGGEATWDDYALLVDNQTFAANYSNTMVLNQAFITHDPGTTIRVVPEPATYAMMGFGLLSLGFVRRRKALKA
ncbi:MAG: PEP-CTERM sorting domain-containing protein [Gemmatimonas sp.]